MSSPKAQTAVPLGPRHCLLISVPASAPYEAFRARQADIKEAQAINLRSYGYASPYIFANSQELAARTRKLARRNPHLAVEPRPVPQVSLVDADPEDTQFADYNESRGWPRYLRYQGQWHDYVVIEAGEDAVARSLALNEVGRKRAVKRLGSEDIRGHIQSLDPRSNGPRLSLLRSPRAKFPLMQPDSIGRR